MPGKAESGEKAQCTWEYMSILSRFPTQRGAARDFFNGLFKAFYTNPRSAPGRPTGDLATQAGQ